MTNELGDGHTVLPSSKRAESPESVEEDSVSAEALEAAQQNHGDNTAEPEFSLTDQASVDSASGGEKRKEELGKNRGEIAFFKLLHAEFKKASHFFDRAQQEYMIREERVREGMEIMKKPNSIMVNEKWSMLAKSIYRLYKDLLLLETFAIMTYCSFSKILKKHDKVTGYDTRAAFMANVVNRANFTEYPKVLAMIHRCERLYEEVSARLVQEGKEGLYEDERLFINMISRLNEQALISDDAPDRKEGRRPAASAPMPIPAAPSKPESLAVSTLRSLVEENDARAAAHVSEDTTADEKDSRKRSAVEAAVSESEKRQKLS